MLFLYNMLWWFYEGMVRLASFRSPKARLFVTGRQHLFEEIAQKLPPAHPKTAWFHCASLGEFEQVRPVLEGFRQQNPDFFIVLTFFSPSGYEVRKNYNAADLVCYLPLDTRKNAERFINLIAPEIVFWVRYDFFYFYLTRLQAQHIPVYLISAAFRNGQLFFKGYGGFYRHLLTCFTHIFVQNQVSIDLLRSLGIKNATLAGDTRFDRVTQTKKNINDIPLATAFKNGEKLLVIGSSWAEDLALLIPFLNTFEKPLKVIIAPHEIKEHYLQDIETRLQKKTIRYSQATPGLVAGFDVLLIDNVGMLASLYACGEFAFVGGAFRQGLHNILEPAAFGMPVFFGPDYQKYPEAEALIRLGGAFSVSSVAAFAEIFTKLYENEFERQEHGRQAADFISRNTGATQIILTHTAFETT